MHNVGGARQRSATKLQTAHEEKQTTDQPPPPTAAGRGLSDVGGLSRMLEVQGVHER